MQVKNLFFTLLILFSGNIFAQTKPAAIGKPIAGDCKNAIPLKLNNNLVYGVTIAPSGFGEVKEIRNGNKLTFEEEHNTAWYLLSIEKSGELTFDIVPQDTTNDYDFLLYTYNDSTFCQSFKQNKLKPVRSNLSNVKKSIKGITGLKPNTLKNSVGEGIGVSYSKSIDVKKGEKYMLILDNVTPNGKGHTLVFSFLKAVEIKGTIISSDSLPIVADITLSDNKGNIIEEAKSNDKGEYKINTKIKENQNYNLTYIAENAFVQTAIINTKDLKGTSVFPDIRTVLPKLKKGEKYKLGNINFYGNVATLLPESFSSVESLYKLMKKNKNLCIIIQGHVNDPSKKRTGMEESFDQTLSEDRAKTIYNYLLKKGIDKVRMTTEGLSNTQMIYPHPENEYQQMANIRVEIKVISIE
jgi:outer membrane protein OmpA-like peptidoglycan-associated protein